MNQNPSYVKKASRQTRAEQAQKTHPTEALAHPSVDNQSLGASGAKVQSSAPPFSQKLAQEYPEQIHRSGQIEGGSVHGGIGGFGGNSREEPVKWEENPPNPPFHPCTVSQAAVFPKDSILGDFCEFARSQCEGADCYIIGAILPVSAAMLGRAVWLPWGAHNLHANLFIMLAGKAGDRKSSTIDLAEAIARKALPPEAFLPKAYSPETMFDEYDKEAGGRSDKIMICDDANATLSDWQKSTNGERIASRFLELYDCKGLSESFRRNRPKKGGAETQRRFIEHTSTSVILGATFSSCMFRNQAVRTGLQRRFLYYVAEGHGRVITWPNPDYAWLVAIADSFAKLAKLSGVFRLCSDAQSIFERYQKANRDLISRSDSFDEALLSRLSSAPTGVLKVAMNFEACRSVKNGSNNLQIQAETMQLAIELH